jgi:hypothetical protein
MPNPGRGSPSTIPTTAASSDLSLSHSHRHRVRNREREFYSLFDDADGDSFVNTVETLDWMMVSTGRYGLARRGEREGETGCIDSDFELGLLEIGSRLGHWSWVLGIMNWIGQIWACTIAIY